MSNPTQTNPASAHKLPWAYTARAYLFFFTVSAAMISVLPGTSKSPRQDNASSEKPTVSKLKRDAASPDVKKVSSVHRLPGDGHGAL
jgi:hypothetical protein